MKNKYLSFLKRIVQLKILGKTPVNAYLRLNRRIWRFLPPFLVAWRPVRSFGRFLNALVRLQASRRQFFGTFFLRNRPELELIRRLSNKRPKGSELRISVLACSQGAEVYSIMWMIRSLRSDLNVIMKGLDVSEEILEHARKGVYSLMNHGPVRVPIFARMTEEELLAMFDRDGDKLTVKPWIKEGITWFLGDAGDPALLYILGPQDIVVANNFMCHMDAPEAERCLTNLSRLVAPGGYLFVSGIDLDIRSRIARKMGWEPVRELLEDIHDGDPSVRKDWPWEYWGLEPMDRARKDWRVWYASVFRLA